ncbi:MAG: FUSC family protein [Dermatophilaceae bacterium]
MRARDADMRRAAGRAGARSSGRGSSGRSTGRAAVRVVAQASSQWLESPWAERSLAWQRRVARRSRSSIGTRLRRLRSRSFFIVQCAISAAIAYFVAGGLLDHPTPFFAAVAAVIVLGQSFGQRLERSVEVVTGVALGVLIGDAFVHLAGPGYWQIAVVIAASMTCATLLDAGVGMTATAGIQSAVVAILVPAPGQAFIRWTDAVIGGLVALLAATITPASPVRQPRLKASEVLSEVSDQLHDTVRALRHQDLPLADATLERARCLEQRLEDLQDSADDGLAVVRTSPFRRRDAPAVLLIHELLDPLEHAIRNLRVLIRRATIALRVGERVPKAYVDIVEGLGQVTREMSEILAVRTLPASAQGPLVRLAELTTYADERTTLSSEVIRGQARSMIVDLLEVTGVPYDEAITYIPESYELGDGHEYDLDPDD